jgi:protein-disulfide isomerase
MSGAKMAGGIVAVVALLALVLATSFRSEPAPVPTDLQPESQEGAVEPQFDIRMKGDLDAPITIFELSDFQCPWCQQFTLETLPTLEAEYIVTGKARLIFINLPIPSLHPNAPAAHEFAMCAASQGRFWPVHDMLFAQQQDWQGLRDPGVWFLQRANSLGLERGPLDACLEQGAMRALIMADLNTAQRGGVNSTPTFVIEGGLLRGAASIEDLRPILDSIYTAKTQSGN